ncbi:hypothetical protein H0E87_027461 [Populus deltoides]|uniref:Uncharacterized protein n=1 Tax=Populus deltoides TaxID=3696 RepID=A0A8T2WXC9_POPDE|nr:hypothetical protein H0E87_027461 [Populus deltoides]
MASLAEAQKPHVKEFVSNIKAQSELSRHESPQLAGFVLDTFVLGMNDLAAEFGVPWYVFTASGAAFIGSMLYLQALHDEQKADLPEYKDSDAELEIPSLVNRLPAKLLPSMVFKRESVPHFLGAARRLKHARGILINTFKELESHAINSLSNGEIPPVYPLGPIVRCKGNSYDVGSNNINDYKDIMQGLDDQPPCSVVFLCFGSWGSFSVDQVKEIAYALEQCGHRFLWCLRKPPCKGLAVEIKMEYWKDFYGDTEIIVSSDDILKAIKSVMEEDSEVRKKVKEMIVDLPSLEHTDVHNTSASWMASLAEAQKPHVKEFVSNIKAQSELSPHESPQLAGFVLDTFVLGMNDLAAEFGVPWYVFTASGAAFIGSMLYLQALHDEQKADLPEYKDSDAELEIPSLVNRLPAKLLPSMLESHAINSLSNGEIPPVYPLGPIVRCKGNSYDVGSNNINDYKDIMQGLDDQPPCSVVFLCFGSWGSFSVDQVKEIAYALEQCGHRFLWCLRKPPCKGLAVEIKMEYWKDFYGDTEIIVSSDDILKAIKSVMEEDSEVRKKVKEMIVDLPSLEHTDVHNTSASWMASLAEAQKPHVKEFVSNIKAQSELSPHESPQLAGFVLDTFVLGMNDLAAEFGVPWYVFTASGAAFIGSMLYLQALHDEQKADLLSTKTRMLSWKFQAW